MQELQKKVEFCKLNFIEKNTVLLYSNIVFFYYRKKIVYNSFHELVYEQINGK